MALSSAERQRRWRQRHPEERRARDRARAEYFRAWKRANPDRMAEYSRRYTERHPERRRATYAAYHERNAERRRAEARIWRQRNPRRHADHVQNRKAQVRGAVGSHTVNEWRALVLAYDFRCAYCGERRPLTRDHVLPIARGGSNAIANMLPACLRCNSQKRGKTLAEFIAQRRPHVIYPIGVTAADEREAVPA